MYLSQAVSLPTPIRIKSDLFLCTHLVQEVQLESAVATCRVLVRSSPAVLVHSRQVHRGGMRPVPSRIARNSPSPIIGCAPGVQKPSAPGGKTVWSMLVEIFYLFYSLCNSSYFYLCTCHRPSLSQHRSESSRTFSYALI
jgi:hypothetical protein